MIQLYAVIIVLLIEAVTLAVVHRYEAWRRKENPQYVREKITKTIIIISILVAIVFAQNITSHLSNPSTHEILSYLAKNINKDLPQKDGKFTIQKVQAEGDRSLVYIISVAENSEQVDFQIVPNELKKVREYLCSSEDEDSRFLRSINAEIIYRYYDEKGVLVQSVLMSNQDCSQLNESATAKNK